MEPVPCYHQDIIVIARRNIPEINVNHVSSTVIAWLTGAENPRTVFWSNFVRSLSCDINDIDLFLSTTSSISTKLCRMHLCMSTNLVCSKEGISIILQDTSLAKIGLFFSKQRSSVKKKKKKAFVHKHTRMRSHHQYLH